MNITLVPYGANSTFSRWFNQYWSESNRRAFPWLCLMILGFFLLFGPHFLLWLMKYLPADELGNSGASILAHQIIVAVATLLAAAASYITFKWVCRPTFLEVSSQGVALLWKRSIFEVRGQGVLWPEITSINLYQPMETTDARLSQLQFLTAKKERGLHIPMGQLDSDEGRQTVADAIAKYALHNVEPAIFPALAPQRTLSFTEIWLEALSAAPSRERLLPLEAGTILDQRYCIKSRLGSGGQGTVYLAEDTKESRDVVLKESILPVYADLVSRRQALEAFHKEAFALESVKHDRIVKFLGSFVADHRAYLVLDFVAGRTLSETVKKDGPIDNARVKKLALDMCEILAALHGQSPPMVHRDFTPDNLILGEDDKLTLIDFAVSVSATSKESGADAEVAGKAAYMAPEQFKGLPQAQSDIYSLGATMYFMLTGENPEPLDESHPIVANDKVDKSLSDIVSGATKLELTERFKNVADLKLALGTIG